MHLFINGVTIPNLRSRYASADSTKIRNNGGTVPVFLQPSPKNMTISPQALYCHNLFVAIFGYTVQLNFKRKLCGPVLLFCSLLSTYCMKYCH